MLYTSSPINKNLNFINEEKKNDIIHSEININNNPLTLKSKNININDSNSIQIINPFDSIASKKQQIQLQSFSNNASNRINNRYSQISNSISLSNSNSHLNKDNSHNDFSTRNRKYNNFSYSSSNRTNKDINVNNSHFNNISKNEKSIINDSNDIKFEIINNDEVSNYKNSNNVFSSSNSNFSMINNNNIIKKNEKFNSIRESDEEDYNDVSQEFLRKINLNDLESYVNKYKPILNNKDINLKNNFEINKRISDIINNSPFDNINMPINNKNGEVLIDNLLTISNIVYIKSLNNEQITEQFNKDFYEQILSAKKFSSLNAGLHEDTNFDSSLISIGQLHIYNGKNKKLAGRKTRNIIDNEGNSFLKALIFNFFENIITDLNLDNVIFIIYIISTKLSLLNLKDINIQEVLTILKIIFTHLEKKNILEAYIVLINAFKENSFFEKGLIYFVKYCLRQFIIDNYVLFNIDYLNDIISTKYINTLNNQFDYQNYIQEKIMDSLDDIKYEVLVYYLLPLIFPINLIIYTNSNALINKLIFKNKTHNNKNSNIYDIELNVKFGNVSIIYSDKYIIKYKNIIPYTNEFNYPVDKIQIIVNNKKDDNSKNILCKECNLYPENYIQLGPKIKPLCEKCLINAINKVINKRYDLLQEDLFYNEEFYCSKIKLTNALNNNLYLSLNDIKILLPNHNDVSEEIYNIIINNKKCNICNQLFKDSKYSISLNPCGHLICDKCFIKFINEITHKRIILNKFEIKTENFEYICPLCKNNRIKNINNFIYKYFDKLEEYEQKAKERFETQVKNFCCICKKVSNKYNFDIEINNNREKRVLKHSICFECKKILDFQKKNSSKRNHQTQFMCEFCNDYHIYNLLNVEKNRGKNKDESCCKIF